MTRRGFHTTLKVRTCVTSIWQQHIIGIDHNLSNTLYQNGLLWEALGSAKSNWLDSVRRPRDRYRSVSKELLGLGGR